MTFVDAGSGVALTTGTGTVSKAGCTAGNLLVIHLVIRGNSEDWSAFSNEVNVEELDGTPGNIQGIQTGLGIGAGSTSRHALFCARVVADGTCSGDFSVGASGEDMFARMYEFSGAYPGTTVAEVFEQDTGTYGADNGTSVAVDAAELVTNSSDRLGLQFVALATDQALGNFTGGDFSEAVSEFGSSTGATATLQLQTASLPESGTISGGQLFISSGDWGCISTAIRPTQTSFQVAVLALDPSSYWRLADSGADDTGAANGTVTGAVGANGLVPTEGGGADLALSFDGSGDYVTTADLYDFAGTLSWTAHFILRPASLAASAQIVSKAPAWRINLLATTGQIQLVRDESENGTWDTDCAVGEVAQIVVTYDGADALLYKNGVEIGVPAGLTASVTGNANSLRLAAAADSVAMEYSGILQHVALWDSALTEADVTTLYDAYQGPILHLMKRRSRATSW